MELFKNRRICLFFCIFIVSCALCAYTVSEINIYVFVSICILAALALGISFVSKKIQIAALTVFLSLCSVLLAMLNFYFRIDRNQRLADEYDGSSHSVLVNVTDVIYISENSSVFAVKTEQIGFDDVSINARLVCNFVADLSVGDELRAQVSLSVYENNFDKDGTELVATLYDSQTAEVKKFDRNIPFSEMIFRKHGISVAVDILQNNISERLEMLLGDNIDGLAKAFLLGDRSDVTTETVRDFRRTGLSHLFAVSGMHITLLLGTVDLVLRKLYVHKWIRCVCVSLLTLPLLLLTGFAMSAVRSVLMLWMAYIFLALRELSDPPTTLFASITLIILIFPYSVYDLGMYLSFLATLGLVTVYPYVEREIPRPTTKNKFKKRILKIIRTVTLIFIMTLICNMFLLPLQWYVFGEVSLISLVANIPLSPLSGIFMIGTVCILLFGTVPIVGNAISLAVIGIGNAIKETVAFMSEAAFATVSLKYFFADILIILFTVSMLLVLIIKTKHKWHVFLPFASFVVIFGVCVSVYNAVVPECVTYYGNGRKELISVTDGDKLALVDTSSASYEQYDDAMSDALVHGVTIVDKIIFTEVNESRISELDYFIRSNIVKNVYIPTPKDKDELDIAIELSDLVKTSGSTVVLYDYAELIEHGSMRICVDMSMNEDTEAFSVIISNGERMFAYADALVFDGDRRDLLGEIFDDCSTLVIGTRHIPNVPYTQALTEKTALIYASEDVKEYSKITGTSNCYVNTKKSICLPIYLK